MVELQSDLYALATSKRKAKRSIYDFGRKQEAEICRDDDDDGSGWIHSDFLSRVNVRGLILRECGIFAILAGY
jgi:hypothetical protein